MKFEDFSWKLMVNEYGTDEIEMVLDSMAPLCKMTLILHNEEKLKMESIAELMGYKTAHTVRNYYWQGMKKLYDYFHPRESLGGFYGTEFNRKLHLSSYEERAGYWEWLIYRHPCSRIQQALEWMQQEKRVVLLLHHGEGKRFEEIATLLCYSTSFIQNIYMRAIYLLHTWFRKHYPMQDRRLLKAYLEILISNI